MNVKHMTKHIPYGEFFEDNPQIGFNHNGKYYQNLSKFLLEHDIKLIYNTSDIGHKFIHENDFIKKIVGKHLEHYSLIIMNDDTKEYLNSNDFEEKMQIFYQGAYFMYSQNPEAFQELRQNYKRELCDETMQKFYDDIIEHVLCTT